MNGTMLCLALLASGMPRAEKACKYTDMVVEEAEKNNIDPVIYASLLYVESRWKTNAHGRSDECGMSQIVPEYYPKLKLSCRQLKKPHNAIAAGAKVLGYWVNVYGKGNYKIGLCGYNVGYRCKGRNKYKRGFRYAKHVNKWASKIIKALEESAFVTITVEGE
jgi:soluble lytic murein transglycosylase-like protein|tara:strand:- start:35036 stop:35524 length:489 start_codon:yes stop_codon:yes gene_type:complete